MEKAKPYVICHMAATVNGKIISENWGSLRDNFGSVYEDCHQQFDSQAWMCGRVTMQKDFVKSALPVLTAPDGPVPREPFVGDDKATSFAIAVDAHGKLGWTENETSGDHVIAILTEGVSDAYLHYLRERKISYLFAGKDSIDARSALEQLAVLFPIRTIMLEGGGVVNGEFLTQGVIDEISLLVLPVADASSGANTVFELMKTQAERSYKNLRLINTEKLEHDVLWLRYGVL